MKYVYETHDALADKEFFCGLVLAFQNGFWHGHSIPVAKLS